MANLRDIINAATPGPWSVKQADWNSDLREGTPVIRSAGEFEDYIGSIDSNELSKDEVNAAHIAAYSPDHALLMEDALAAATASGVCVFCGGWVGGDDAGPFHAEGCAFAPLTAYRKAHGYE